MFLSFAHDLGQPESRKSFDKLLQEISAGYLLHLSWFSYVILGLMIAFFSEYSKTWQLTIKIEYRNQTDAIGPS